MNRPPRYWPFYCEENVWLACEDAPPGSQVAFVSNPQRAVALCFQRAAGDGVGPVVWDYHVILIVPEPSEGWAVVDLDTTLGERVPASRYFERTFTAADRLPAELQPRFRLVPADEYRARLSSDRRHMRRADGSWSAEPPPWPAIGDGEPNLARFIDVDGAFIGEVLELHDVRERFD